MMSAKPSFSYMYKLPTLVPAEKAKWEQLKDAPSGIMISKVWGDPYSGAPFGAFVKFPPNLDVPLHTHGSDMKIIVLEGAYVYVPEHGTEQRFGAGSFLSYGAGDRHSTKSDASSESLFFIEQTGKFDLNPV
jgi:Domain of unknown function (DUF4437)